ncbi:hypothetical protein HU720_21625 [Pseudomonas sp. SWRI51]|uniref:hypothetical protein n=1 Tax=Pseudomonas sp. SWRI51 TaxID=2745491 RepID=UPI0016455137|nr:hypothetical protein [Pseudomonas sp. SWRI51]MBC3413900.1 hypothetical protein [Pseudomonas sp. SWRI51]
MNKIVPDPPTSKSSQHPFFTINEDMPTTEALIHAIQLMRGIEDTIDEYCCALAGEPGLGMLVNAAHNVQMGRALAEHALKGQKT